MSWTNRVILVIDDEPQMCDLIARIFQRAGAVVNQAHNGSAGLQSLVEQPPDLVILDILMPEIDGIAILKEIRLRTDLPVVMLTAVKRSRTLVNSLDSGADAYMTKPFRGDELLATCQAVLRRTQVNDSPNKPADYDDGLLVIELDKRSVILKGERAKLTGTEFKLLAHLLRSKDNVCLIEDILAEVWAESYQGRAENVHVFIWQLRQKIEPDPKNPRYIISEHSVGYRFTSHE